MANIMMTDVCNLNCPYCFANEFVNKDRNEITEINFDKAVDFIVGDGSRTSVGLIGGEPTIHSKFEYFVRKLIHDERVKTVVIYTNGIAIDKYWDIITHNKVKLLINCNTPKDIGETNYKKLCENLEHLIVQKEFKESVTLGINMYNADFEYEYILELLVKYHFNHVRVSITVPNVDEDRNIDAHSYFNRMKPRLFDFFYKLLENNIIPNFDCNKIPSCLISTPELDAFKKYLENAFIRENISKSNISNTYVTCSPVIDIRQDLTAVRCFGLSEYTKVKIEDFKSIKDLEKHYIRTIDAYAYNTVYSEKCASCYDRDALKCSGGCLAFKIKEILKIQQFANEQIERYIIDEKNRITKSEY